MAILSIPANLLPVLMTGLMGLLGIRLDVATVTIAAIVLGLVVDDTVQIALDINTNGPAVILSLLPFHTL